MKKFLLLMMAVCLTFAMISCGDGSGGGVYVGTKGTFQIANGTIYGNTETVTSLRNTATSGATLFKTSYATEVQRGTFTGVNGAFVSKADLTAPDSNTVKVSIGDLQ
jgi:hypothetical protein